MNVAFPIWAVDYWGLLVTEAALSVVMVVPCVMRVLAGPLRLRDVNGY